MYNTIRSILTVTRTLTRLPLTCFMRETGKARSAPGTVVCVRWK